MRVKCRKEYRPGTSDEPPHAELLLAGMKEDSKGCHAIRDKFRCCSFYECCYRQDAEAGKVWYRALFQGDEEQVTDRRGLTGKGSVKKSPCSSPE